MGRISENPESILKNGYLLKQGDIIKLQWHLRYFVLTKECLCYYKKEENSEQDVPKGVIFFNDMSLFVEDIASDKAKTKFCLKIVKRSTNMSNRTLVLSTFCEDERNQWLAQMLLAKAMALVCDRSWIGAGNDSESKPRPKSPTVNNRSELFSTAKGVLNKCRRRLSSSNRRGCSFEELSTRKRSKSNLAWRYTMADLTVV